MGRLHDSWVFQKNGLRFEATVSGSLTTSSGEVMHDWVRAGMGIALKASWDLQPDLAAGTIVQCLEPYWCDQIDQFAIFANRSHPPPHSRVSRLHRGEGAGDGLAADGVTAKGSKLGKSAAYAR